MSQSYFYCLTRHFAFTRHYYQKSFSNLFNERKANSRNWYNLWNNFSSDCIEPTWRIILFAYNWSMIYNANLTISLLHSTQTNFNRERAIMISTYFSGIVYSLVHIPHICTYNSQYLSACICYNSQKPVECGDIIMAQPQWKVNDYLVPV